MIIGFLGGRVAWCTRSVAARLDSEIADIEDIKLQGHSQSVQDKSIYIETISMSRLDKYHLLQITKE